MWDAQDLLTHIENSIAEGDFEMNAFNKGVDAGLDYQLLGSQTTKEQYEQAGLTAAQRAYKQSRNREQFAAGWNSKWTERHAKDCQCENCKFYASLIDD